MKNRRITIPPFAAVTASVRGSKLPTRPRRRLAAPGLKSALRLRPENRPLGLWPGLLLLAGLLVLTQSVSAEPKRTGYDLGRYCGDLKDFESDLKIFIYDSNHPNQIMTLVPNLPRKIYTYLEDSKR